MHDAFFKSIFVMGATKAWTKENCYAKTTTKKSFIGPFLYVRCDNKKSLGFL